MASASAAANQTVGGTAELIFDATVAACKGKCSKFLVRVRSTAARALLIHVMGLHTGDELTGDYFAVSAGQEVTFEHNIMGIARIWAKGDGGDCIGVDWTVIARQGY